jgi:hypothetical protein
MDDERQPVPESQDTGPLDLNHDVPPPEEPAPGTQQIGESVEGPTGQTPTPTPAPVEPDARQPSEEQNARESKAADKAEKIKALRTAAEEVSAAATSLLDAVPDDFDLTLDRLKAVETAHQAITRKLAEFDNEMRAVVVQDDHLAVIQQLLAVAALSESLREWFPVDPEMTSVRDTVLIPGTMTAPKPEPEPPTEPDELSLDVLMKRLLAHLAK